MVRHLCMPAWIPSIRMTAYLMHRPFYTSSPDHLSMRTMDLSTISVVVLLFPILQNCFDSPAMPIPLEIVTPRRVPTQVIRIIHRIMVWPTDSSPMTWFSFQTMVFKSRWTWRSSPVHSPPHRKKPLPNMPPDKMHHSMHIQMPMEYLQNRRHCPIQVSVVRYPHLSWSVWQTWPMLPMPRSLSLWKT